MSVRQGDITYGEWALDGHLEAFWFLTDGTTDPSEFSANICSVTRFTSDGANELYRIKVRRPLPFSSNCAVGESYTHVGVETLSLDVDRILGALNSTVPTLDDEEIDIRVVIRSTDVATNQVAAGSYIKGILCLEMS